METGHIKVEVQPTYKVEIVNPEPATSTPDWNQNDSTASDYIKNRPGGYTVNYPAINIEWDGVIGDRVSVDIGASKFVKVSDDIPKAEQLVGGTFTRKEGNESYTYTITDIYIQDAGNGIYGSDIFLVVNKAPANFVHPSTGAVMAVFPETGVYFLYNPQGEMPAYVSSLSLPAKSRIVPIPQEYVEGLEETTANANQALNNATEAQSTANEIKNAVQPADTHNNGIKIKRYIGFKDILDQYSSPVMPSDINGYIFLRKSSKQNGVNLVIDNGTGGGGTNVCASIGSDGLMLSENSKIYAPVTPSSYGPIISIYNDDYRAYVEFIKDACLVLPSSTPNSAKKFKITVDDTGTISATEVTT